LSHSLSGQIPVTAHVFGPLSYTALNLSIIVFSYYSLIHQSPVFLSPLSIILYLPKSFQLIPSPVVISQHLSLKASQMYSLSIINASLDCLEYSWFLSFSFHFSLKAISFTVPIHWCTPQKILPIICLIFPEFSYHTASYLPESPHKDKEVAIFPFYTN